MKHPITVVVALALAFAGVGPRQALSQRQERESATSSPLIPPPVPLPRYARLVFQMNMPVLGGVYSDEILTTPGGGVSASRLTEDGFADIKPRLNREANRITYASDRGGNFDIYTMDTAGGDIRRLTADAAVDTDPFWSPDGNKIVFTSLRDGQAEIYVMRADGSSVARLTNHAGEDTRPAWSPDGAWIAFVSTRDVAAGTGGRIWLMDANGANPRPLSSATGSDNPNWSPDGGMILFDGYLNGWTRRNLLTIDRDGGNEQIVALGGSGWEGYAEDFTACDWLNQGFVFMNGPLLMLFSTVGEYQFLGYGSIRYPDFQSLDLSPPTTSVDPLPAVSPADVLISWSGSATDGPAVEFQYEIQWRDGLTGAWTTVITAEHTAPTQGYARGLGGHTYYVRSRGVDAAGNAEPWPAEPETSTTVEAQPPTTTMTANRSLVDNSLVLGWSAIDPGNSGISSFDIEYRIEPASSWTRLFTRTTMTSTLFAMDPNRIYHFRARAIDRAENIEPWTPGNGDSVTYPPIWSMAGRLLDNAGVPVSGGQVEMRSGDVSSATFSVIDGEYAAGVAPHSAAVSVTVSKAGYGPLPATVYTHPTEKQADYYLPPQDNALANPGFESALAAGGWITDGLADPRLDPLSRHTGRFGLTLGGLRLEPGANVSRSPGESSAAALAVAPDGQPHAAWIERSGDMAELRYASRDLWGWSAPLSLFGEFMPAGLALPPGYRPELAVDVAGSVHLLWRTWPLGNVYYGLWSTGGGWSLYLVASGLEDDSLPRLSVDSGRNAHLTWHQSSGQRRDIYYLRRTSSGQWSPLENVTGGDPYLTNARHPAIGVDITGTAYLAWENGAGFYATRPISGAWSTPAPALLSTLGFSQARLAVGPDGIAHAAWRATRPGAPTAIAHASFRATLVSQPAIVFTTTATVDLKRILVDADGQPHLVWTTHDGAAYHATRGAGGAWTPTSLMASNGRLSVTVDIAATASGVWAAWSAGNTDTDPISECSKWTRSAGWLSFGRCAEAGRFDPSLVAEASGKLGLAYSPRADAARDVWYTSWRDAPDGASWISQRLTLPITLTSPGLSFLYRIDGSSSDAAAAFTVTAETDLAATAVFTTFETPGAAWRHVWRDMSAFAGQSITLTFAIDPQDGSGGARLALDEVSLGSTAPDLRVASALPPILAPLATQTAWIQSGNAGGGSAAASVMTLTLPAGLSLVSAEPPPDVSGTFLIWQVPALPAKALMPGIVLTFSVDPGMAGITVTPTLVIAGASPELEWANNAWQAAIFIGYRAYAPLAWTP